MRAENARDFSAKTARISTKFVRIFEQNARTWHAKSAQRHLRCFKGRKEPRCIIFLLAPRVCRAFRVTQCRFSPKFVREKGAILHEVLRKIGGPRMPNGFKPCSQSAEGPGRVYLSITVILMIVRCVARRKRARFFGENRAVFNEILPDFRKERTHMA